MEPRPHITFIHGIANKPAADALLASWIAVLAENRGVDLAALSVSSSMVYWADVLYAEPWTEMVQPAESVEAAAGPLSLTPPEWEAELPLDQQVFVASLRGKLQIAEAKSLPALSAAEGVTDTAERVPLPWFLKRPLMERLLRDVHHYLFNVQFSPRRGETYFVQGEIRRRLIAALQRVRARPHVVVAHSLGTVIAYDCLQRVADCPSIDRLMTIGSPLGLDEIQDQLRPEWTRNDGFPAKLGHWTNVFDRLDPVCGLDPRLANDFRQGGQKVIEDIHEPNHGWFRHPIEKYLRGPRLRRALKRALAA